MIVADFVAGRLLHSEVIRTWIYSIGRICGIRFRLPIRRCHFFLRARIKWDIVIVAMTASFFVIWEGDRGQDFVQCLHVFEFSFASTDGKETGFR